MTQGLKIKVCGMKYSDNIKDIATYSPDYMGFIFFQKSVRFIEDASGLPDIPASIKKTAVFVNESPYKIINVYNKFNFAAVQLHGEETPDYCKTIHDVGLSVIKAFSVDGTFDFAKTAEYEDVVDFFLFDTKGKNYGGNGCKFNWKILEHYKGKIPFFLSGGIGPEDAEALMGIGHPMFYGIDLNSGFETEPARKDIIKLADFFSRIKTSKLL